MLSSKCNKAPLGAVTFSSHWKHNNSKTYFYIYNPILLKAFIGSLLSRVVVRWIKQMKQNEWKISQTTIAALFSLCSSFCFLCMFGTSLSWSKAKCCILHLCVWKWLVIMINLCKLYNWCYGIFSGTFQLVLELISYLARRGTKWTDTAYHSLGMQQWTWVLYRLGYWLQTVQTISWAWVG